ncbi:unnamed protein product [marine sediment metagenome]|uniref:Uncharacterized protein n=1 Tax=marine sediment metagenome TaxID=412755 RepID=X1L6P9_9ZZZZ
MSEILEGVLSEKMLNELASDLGMEHEALRKHPFFRVLRGRVILTYPLKSYPSTPLFVQAQINQVDPTLNEYYEALNFVGAGALYSCYVWTNDAVTVLTKSIKVTIDGVAFTVQSADEADDSHLYITQLETGILLTATPPPMHYIPFQESLKIEFKTDTTLVGGKTLICAYSMGDQS